MLHRNGYAWLGVCIATTLGVSGCDKVKINPGDSSKPTAVIKVKGSDGQYAVQSAVNMSAGSGVVELMCIVEDAQGVKQAKLDIPKGTDGCNVGGSIYSGVFQIAGLPNSLQQSLTGDADGKVLTKLPLLATIKGPLTCTVPGAGTGVPYGAKIKVSCTGTNWSSNPASSTASTVLTVTLQ